MPALENTYRDLKQRIARLSDLSATAQQQQQQPAPAVRLIAVSKQHPANAVVKLARLGHRDFGENYAQESREKIKQVAEWFAAAPGARGSSDSPDPQLCWHFIGHIQSRKCAFIAQHFDWVHTIDRIEIADKLNQARAASLQKRAPLNVLIQLNLDGEPSKSGVSAAELPPLAAALRALPNLRLRGLMMIPKPQPDLQKQRAVFRRGRELRDTLNAASNAPHGNLEHLSMGMSGDMEAALAEGATMLRIGTAIFGPRPPKPPMPAARSR